MFTRPDHRIRSLEALKNQVESCEARQTSEWPQSGVDDVIAFLDATYYKFGASELIVPPTLSPFSAPWCFRCTYSPAFQALHSKSRCKAAMRAIT